jgi:hypothetical protein
MKRNFVKMTFAFLTLSIIGYSCKKDDNSPVNEEELITTLRLNLKESGTTTTKVFEFKDPDGEGGNPPTKFDPIVLDANKTYTCDIEVLNESVTPSENITAEILDEANDHQFYFEPIGVNVNITNLNNDANGLPVGLSSSWTTGAVSSGTLKVTLKHKPGTKAAGDPTSKGETDIEVIFQTSVQ